MKPNFSYLRGNRGGVSIGGVVGEPTLSPAYAVCHAVHSASADQTEYRRSCRFGDTAVFGRVISMVGALIYRSLLRVLYLEPYL